MALHARLALVVVFAAVLAGCAGDAEENDSSSSESLPTTLTLARPVHHLDVLAREPMLVEHPDGTLFVSGYDNRLPEASDPKHVPYLWKSGDGGATWERVDVGTVAEGAIGNSCVDLAVAGDGTLYFVTMGFDLTAWRGTHVTVGVSHDVGDSWSWTMLSNDEYDDRPWVGVAPDGTAHVIWNDGSGVAQAVSSDSGRTWMERERVHPHGGSSHLAVGPGGEVAVRISPLSASGNRYDDGVELIAVSTDGGVTWQKHEPPGTRLWPRSIEEFEDLPRWVEPLAWDSDGALYHLWGEGSELWLGRSADRGATWQSWQVAHDDDRVFYPYLVANGPGQLAASWFSGREETLSAHVARIDVPAAGGAPQVFESDPFQLDVWRAGGATPTRETGGEYMAVAFLSSDRLAVVTPVQDAERRRWGFSWWTAEAPR